jgi:uncharacterized protein YecT (DUF1311 family)
VKNIFAGVTFILLCASYITAQDWPQTERYRKGAHAALLSQMSKEGKDCVGADTTYAANICLGKVSEETQKDFDQFYKNLVALLDNAESAQEKLEEAQDQWEQYRTKTCDAVDETHKGGSIRPSANMECYIRLARSRMRDLDFLYEGALHR